MSREDEWDENNEEEGKKPRRQKKKKMNQNCVFFQKWNQVEKALHMFGNKKQRDFKRDIDQSWVEEIIEKKESRQFLKFEHVSYFANHQFFSYIS